MSVVIPCFNEQENILPLLDSALKALPSAAARFEIIVVDDGSRDETSHRVEEAMRREPRLRLVRHAANRGYGAAVRSGFSAAHYAWVCLMDGDRQFIFEELPRLVEKTGAADIVSGWRRHRADPWHRRLNARIYAWAIRIFFGLHARDINCAFKLFRSEVLHRLDLRAKGATINTEILAQAKQLGLRVEWVEVTHRPRIQGEPTGARLRVIARAMREFLLLWKHLNVRF